MVGTADQTKNGPWLVKSGDRVLGPYSTDQVAQLLRDREIVVIDEIISPESRWAYIRDVGAFTNIVEDIRRNLMTSREDTEIQGYTSIVTADDNAATQTQHHVTSETVTEIAKPITPVMAPRERKPDLKQLGLEPVDPVEAAPPSKRPPGLVIGGVIVVLGALVYHFDGRKKFREAL